MNNLYWLVARGHIQAIGLMVGEATGFTQGLDRLGALHSEPAPPPHNRMLEAYLNRPARWEDVERVVLNWSDDPAAGADGLVRATRQRQELEAFARQHGFDFEVVLHRDGDPPLDLFRFPRAFVTVPGSADVPITSAGLLRGDVTVTLPGDGVSASLVTPPEGTGVSDGVLEVSVPAGVGRVDTEGRLVLPRRDWSKVVVRGLVRPGGLDASVAGRLSDYDGESLPRAQTSFGPAGPDGARPGVGGAVAGRAWLLVPVGSRDDGVDIVLAAKLYQQFGIAVFDAVLVRGVGGDPAAYGVAVEATPGLAGLAAPDAAKLGGVRIGVAGDLLLGGGVVVGGLAEDVIGVVRSPQIRATPLVALGRRAVLSGDGEDVLVDAAWADAVTAMTAVQWFAAAQQVWAGPDDAIRQVVQAQVGLPRRAQVLADKLVERRRWLPLPRVALAQLRQAGLVPAPQVAGLRVVDTPLGWHLSVDGAVPPGIADATPAGPGDFRVTVDPVEVAAGRVSEEQIEAAFAGLAPAVAQFTSLDLRPSSGGLTEHDMTGWASKVSRWAAERGEPVGSYGAHATATVTAPRVSFDVLPSELEAFALGANGDLATPTHPELAAEFRFPLPGGPDTYLTPVSPTPSLERHGFEDGGRLLPGTGGWAAKQLHDGLLVYQPPLPFAPPGTLTELSGVELVADGSATDALPRGVPRIFVVTAGSDRVVDLSRWTRIGEQLGANPGGTYQSPEGVRYYVKEVALAGGRGQRDAHVLVLQPRRPQRDTGRTWPGGAWPVQRRTDIHPVRTRADPSCPDPVQPSGLSSDDVFAKKARRGFAVAAWLAHWDSTTFGTSLATRRANPGALTWVAHCSTGGWAGRKDGPLRRYRARTRHHARGRNGAGSTLASAMPRSVSRPRCCSRSPPPRSTSWSPPPASTLRSGSGSNVDASTSSTGTA